jgi:hypothetical protein
MRYRGFGKAPKKCNMQNRNNLARSKSVRDAWARRQDPELYINGKKFKALLKKEAKHRRTHGKKH